MNMNANVSMKVKVFAGLRREVGHGGIVPAGYHMAWYEPRRRLGIYYPAPLHWLLRALREIRYRWRVATLSPGIECAEVFQMQRAHREREHLATEYARGYLAGWRECFHTCLDAVTDEIESAEDRAWEIRALLPGATEPGKEN
jgi:hypothetical protein